MLTWIMASETSQRSLVVAHQPPPAHHPAEVRSTTQRRGSG